MLGIETRSPTDGWASRTNEPRVGAILKVLYGTLAEGLARMAGIGRVCSK